LCTNFCIVPLLQRCGECPSHNFGCATTTERTCELHYLRASSTAEHTHFGYCVCHPAQIEHLQVGSRGSGAHSHQPGPIEAVQVRGRRAVEPAGLAIVH